MPADEGWRRMCRRAGNFLARFYEPGKRQLSAPFGARGCKRGRSVDFFSAFLYARPMLIIFDVDGTLIGGEAADWLAFDTAIESVLKFVADETFFAGLPEITAQAIAEAAVRASGAQPGNGLEKSIHDEYFRGLRRAHSSDPQTFQARSGVRELLQRLASMPDVRIALATGDWHSTITFKLAAAGIDISHLPMATSSDAPRRAEIIRLASERAGLPLSQAIYVGDGVWDLRACRELGIAFIGTGERTHRLKESGAEHLVEPLETAAFLALLRALRPS
jgi:phosphoglycolate phosphatase-like HAD superfamily hydrolase